MRLASSMMILGNRTLAGALDAPAGCLEAVDWEAGALEATDDLGG